MNSVKNKVLYDQAEVVWIEVAKKTTQTIKLIIDNNTLAKVTIRTAIRIPLSAAILEE